MVKILSQITIALSTIVFTACTGSNDCSLVEMNARRMADVYRTKGMEKLKQSDYIGAYEDYSKAIEINPKCANAYANRGKILMIYQNYAEAIDDFSKAVELDSTYFFVYHKNSDSTLSSKTFSDTDKSLHIESQHIDRILYRGSTSYNEQEFSEAIADFSKVIGITPDNMDGYYCRANCYLVLNNYYEAIKDYSKVIELEPNNAEAFYYRGYSKFKLGQSYSAFCDFNKAGLLGITEAYNDFCDLSSVD